MPGKLRYAFVVYKHMCRLCVDVTRGVRKAKQRAHSILGPDQQICSFYAKTQECNFGCKRDLRVLFYYISDLFEILPFCLIIRKGKGSDLFEILPFCLILRYMQMASP